MAEARDVFHRQYQDVVDRLAVLQGRQADVALRPGSANAVHGVS